MTQNADEHIDSWAQARASAGAPPDFADRVVAAMQPDDRVTTVVEVFAVGAAVVIGGLRIAAALLFLVTPPGVPS